MVNDGWLTDVLIPIKLVKLAIELLRNLHENIAEAKASKKPIYKEYGKLVQDQGGMELDIY